MDAPDTLTLHATAVAVDRKAVLITGASGAGKSSLALEMMTRGATLVADDKVILTRNDQSVTLTCPKPLLGLIEARGVGLLHAEAVPSASLCLVVDMDQLDTDRMPPRRDITFFDQKFPLLHNVASQHFPAAIIQYLKTAGRS
jgi:HPr kinase/phosphorylase